MTFLTWKLKCNYNDANLITNFCSKLTLKSLKFCDYSSFKDKIPRKSNQSNMSFKRQLTNRLYFRISFFSWFTSNLTLIDVFKTFQHFYELHWNLLRSLSLGLFQLWKECHSMIFIHCMRNIYILWKSIDYLTTLTYFTPFQWLIFCSSF